MTIRTDATKPNRQLPDFSEKGHFFAYYHFREKCGIISAKPKRYFYRERKNDENTERNLSISPTARDHSQCVPAAPFPVDLPAVVDRARSALSFPERLPDP